MRPKTSSGCLKKIGQMLRIDFATSTPANDSFTSVSTGLSTVSNRCAICSNFADVGDVSEGTASELRHLGGEKEIRRAADGNGIKARVARLE